MGFFFGLTIVGSFLLVFLSTYPGVLPDLSVIALVCSPFWFPTMCMGAVFSLDLSNQVADFTSTPLHRRRWMPLATMILILNAVLFWSGTPRRLAFILSRPAFGPYVASAPAPLYGGNVLDRRLGVYHVDLFAADLRGGVYFRTHRGLDGLSLRTMCYGFAHRPNPMGSPFGDAKYGLSHLVGDWYCFAALNDG
jgi:hypothetical protein